MAPTKFVAVCRDCGWKIVAESVDEHVRAHVARARHREARGVTVEVYEDGHPTMTHEDAERIGQCWHADALREDASR